MFQHEFLSQIFLLFCDLLGTELEHIPSLWLPSLQECLLFPVGCECALMEEM